MTEALAEAPETVDSAIEAPSTVNRVFDSKPEWKHGNLPSWFTQAREDAWNEFLALPMPGRKDQCWRFANTKLQDFSAFVAFDASAADVAGLIERSRGLAATSTRVIFVNGRLVKIDGGDEGVVCLPFIEALAEYGSVIEKHFMTRQGELGGRKFAALHAARTNSGVFVFAPRGVEVKHPVEIFHWVTGDNAAAFPHTLVVTEDNASVSVVEHFQSANDNEAGFAVGAVELVAQPGSRINYVGSQRWGSKMKAVHLALTEVARDASVTGCFAQLGSAWCRVEAVSHLIGKGANSNMLSIVIADDNQEIDQRTLQHHAEPSTTSNLLYKNALYGKSRSIFAGLIQVDEGAHQTDAYQTCRNLLMSNEVEANSMPGLEINADGVKCSHGSTSSKIDDDEIFYFIARGIRPDVARKLIAIGFTLETIKRLKHEAIEALLVGQIERRFDEVTS
ncbi:MAG: Fe-S cluster assembly protein SufD [Verrucomicrobiales bacterium]|jgi:Fe-S cluster assembly protein SufD